MTLYGFAREPDSTGTDDDVSSPVPQQRAASAPVPVSTADNPPTLDESAGEAGRGSSESDGWSQAGRAAPAQSDLWGLPVPAAATQFSDVAVPGTADPGLWSTAPMEPDLWAPPAPDEPLSAEPAVLDPAVLRPDVLRPDVLRPAKADPVAASRADQVSAAGAMPVRPVRAEGPSETPAGEVAELPVGQSDHDWLASVPGLDDDDEIVAWDRRPLMVAIAGGVALVVLAILSGVATVRLVSPSEPPAAWQPAGPASQATSPATPTPAAGGGAGNPGALTLSGVGDVIMGTEPDSLPPNGGAGFFDPVKDALAADVVMGNLETPLTPDTKKVKCAPATPTAGAGSASPTPGKSTDCFQFYLPPAYAGHLRDGGFTVMNLANNHTNDMGTAGLANTRLALDAAGVQHTGAPNQITLVEVKGVKVAVLGFSVYSWGQNLNNIPAAVNLVRRASEQADLVVIQMQGGAEGTDKTHVTPGHETYAGEDRGDLVAFSHAVIDAGADVVFGHGPHVMRGMEFYKGRLIAYSLGNFCGYAVLASSGISGVGGVLKVSLNKDGTWASGKLVPTMMVNRGLPAPDPQKRALAMVDGLGKEDFGPAAPSISATDGSISPPPTG